MNAHNHRFTVEPWDNAAIIARSVATGCASMLPAVDHEHYSFEDWQEAACEAEVDGDYDRFRRMLAVEVCHSEFIEWQRESEAREWTDFAEWLSGRSNWGDEFTLALEHERLCQARQLAAIARAAERRASL